MKKIISYSIALLGVLCLTVTSCNKENEKKPFVPVEFSKLPEAEKVKFLKNDEDWQINAENQMKLIVKIVESNVDINTIDFTNKSSYLNALGITNEEYDDIVSKIRTSTERLNKKFNLEAEKNALGLSCKSCIDNPAVAASKMKAGLIELRNNSAKYKRLKHTFNSAHTNSLVEVAAPGDEQVGGLPDCNNWRFYLCGSACVITAPTAVLFAACMAMCVAEFC
jgi:hypothetical protein